MPPRLLLGVTVVLATALFAAAHRPAAQTLDLNRHIDTLSSFDYAARVKAARMLRRAPAADAVPALSAAARGHADQFVRYRALVLLTAFNAGESPDLMRSLLADRNDRVREVVYRWFERHPDPTLRPTLVAALETEQAEFVRPSLVRALAALPPDVLVQQTLVTEVGRGFDFARAAVIGVLGERRAGYAVEAIAAVALLDGPLQDDAVLALGRIGDRSRSKLLSAMEKPAAEVAPAVQAAACLLGDECAARIEWLSAAARTRPMRPEVVRAAAAALAVIAEERPVARAALLRLGSGTEPRLRDEMALAFSGLALRRPDDTIAWLTEIAREERALATDLLAEGFASLEEDFAEEQFFAALRAAYWQAADGSAARAVAAALIERLDF